MKIVFNTSPLIFLTRLGYLEPFLARSNLLQANQYFVPQAIPNEISAKQDDTSRALQQVFTSQQIMIQPVTSITSVNSLNQRLGRGESEAITLAIELNADYIILDDAAARREASRSGLQVKGTLAIIRKPQQEKQVSIADLDQLYRQWTEIGFRVKRSIFEQIFSG